ncbi:TonB-dependent receptor [Sphingomonas sp. dw_22]|uniref:TonB-dependent receptor n=1 Tax=Sphingomonas sp. dw_22 TaxID=2721175 RepID=UPI001BD30358|nr:TonB-dependent receptor [Sphingomonas sp. dw_22]
MRTKLFAGVAFATLMIPASAFAQSTGSTDFEDQGEIVVTGSTANDQVAGIRIPDSPKAKVVLTQELIERQTAGQSINQTLNMVPGVSFTNNDPWGSSGGNFTIRGFDSSRISQTFDGIPLNDSGNYAVYTNQQIDSELIDNVNVNLGSTDVDSPTASAVGGTVNINSLTPSKEFGAMLVGSYGNIIAPGAGDRPMFRAFGLVNTGDLTGHGTTAWISASSLQNESSFASYGKIRKSQYNAKIRQEIGSNGDFVSLAMHYNVNRNNFGGSPLTVATVALDNKRARFYDVSDGICTINTSAVAGTVDAPNSCGSSFERRYNPSNTGNIRLNSRFTLAQGLIFSVDAAYQTVKANGGGTSIAYEGLGPNGTTGVFFTTLSQFNSRAAAYYFAGRDLNGDGDALDGIRVVTPSQTKTNRYTAVANLAYDLNENNRVRLSYTFDRARHRQTGEAGLLQLNGEPFDVFPVNDPLLDVNGDALQKRNRKSVAMLNQVAGEYRGKFLNDQLTVLLGGRVPFFQRDLNNFCFTTDTSGNVNCANANAAAYAAANPYTVAANGRPSGAAAPQSRTYNYNKFLPNVGATYHLTPEISLAANWAKNISVPGTDTLYNSLYIPASNPAAKPTPETSDSFDLGLRYTSNKVQASVAPWYSTYHNRLVSAFNDDCQCSVDTNLGNVKKWGVDGSIAYQPIEPISLYAFGSYIGSKIEDQVAGLAAGQSTEGKRERNVPEFMYGGRIQGSIAGFDLGVQAKRTTSRFLNDINTIKIPGYTVVDLDVRYSLVNMGFKNTYLQLNVTNLFDKFYIGSFSGGLTTAASTNANFGAPRAIQGTLSVGF